MSCMMLAGQYITIKTKFDAMSAAGTSRHPLGIAQGSDLQYKKVLGSMFQYAHYMSEGHSGPDTTKSR